MCETTISDDVSQGASCFEHQGMAIMTEAMHKYFDPLITMNRRISVGVGMLAIILLGEMALAFVRPLA
jgi:hypothetical protein